MLFFEKELSKIIMTSTKYSIISYKIRARILESFSNFFSKLFNIYEKSEEDRKL